MGQGMVERVRSQQGRCAWTARRRGHVELLAIVSALWHALGPVPAKQRGILRERRGRAKKRRRVRVAALNGTGAMVGEQ